MMFSEEEDYFDFSIEEDLPEEQSPKKRQCPHCGKPIPADSLFCLFCGQAVSQGNKKIWVIVVVILVLISFLLWGLIL